MSQQPLVGTILKLNRAEEHFHDIKDMVNGFIETNFYETVTERNSKRRLTARTKNVRYPKPELSVLIGDCIFNFRSALDQLAFALAAGHTDPLPDKFVKSSAFPIYNRRAKYRGHGARPARDQTRGMSRSARAAIERMQPYHRRQDPRLVFLWILDQLSNIDKHRLVHLTGAVGVRSSFQVSSTGPGPVIIKAIRPIFGPIEENAPVARVYGEFGPKAEMKVEAFIRPDVVFDWASDIREIRGRSVMLTLLNIRECILFSVLKPLKPELGRIYPGWTPDSLLLHRVTSHSSAMQRQSRRSQSRSWYSSFRTGLVGSRSQAV